MKWETFSTMFEHIRSLHVPHVSRRFQAGAASLRLHLRCRGPLPGVPGAASSAREGVTTPSCSSLALRAGNRLGFLAAIGALIGTTEGTFLEAGKIWMFGWHVSYDPQTVWLTLAVLTVVVKGWVPDRGAGRNSSLFTCFRACMFVFLW